MKGRGRGGEASWWRTGRMVRRVILPLSPISKASHHSCRSGHVRAPLTLIPLPINVSVLTLSRCELRPSCLLLTPVPRNCR